MRKTIEYISNLPHCEVLPPSGKPNIKDGLSLPVDLDEFYESCGGARLFQNSEYGINIVTPQEFVLANPVIVGETFDDEDISSNWYIVANNGGGEYITIDLGINRTGRCYDSFYDRHAVAGESKIIAMSFMELLERIMQSKGEYWYWLSNQFDLGDAYDDVG